MAITLQIVSETGSTNADILARLAGGEHLAEGYWLVADRQNDGRGRQGRAWLDAPGNFSGSTLVRTCEGDPAPASLSFVAALAVYEAVVNRVAVPAAVSLKWPNDVLFDGAKLAGILLERTGDTTVIGIGANLAWAPSLPDRATSDLRAAGPAPDRDAFAHDLAASFDRELARWREFGLEPLLARWLAAAHPLGARLAAHGPDGVRVSGTFAGLEPDGALRLRLAGGAMHVIHAADVTLEGA